MQEGLTTRVHPHSEWHTDLGSAAHPPATPSAADQLFCTSFSRGEILPIPGVLRFNELESAAKRLTESVGTNQIYLHYVLLKQTTRPQIHHPINQRNLNKQFEIPSNLPKLLLRQSFISACWLQKVPAISEQELNK